MKIIRCLGAVLTAMGLIALGGAAAAQETLVINSFGGAYEKIHRELVIGPFEKAHNVEVKVITAYSGDTLAQLRAQKDNPQFDVVHFSGGLETAAAAGRPPVPDRSVGACQPRPDVPVRRRRALEGHRPDVQDRRHRPALQHRAGFAPAFVVE